MDQELRGLHTTWLQQKDEEEQKAIPGIEEREAVAGVTAEVETPDAFTAHRTATVFPLTFNTSTTSNLALTESDEDVEGGNGERIPTRHGSFYLEDGNVEIVCGYTIFRVHSPIVSFSSPYLRDILSPSTLLNAPMPEGCSRVVFEDSAQDFAVLLKMIYTPGYAPPLSDVDPVD